MEKVLSVPGAQTQDIIKEYLIYAHPYPRPYKNTQYIVIRKTGGIMDTLYSIQCEFILRPNDQKLEEQITFLNMDEQKSLIGYIDERKNSFGFDEKEEYKFYLLKVERQLSHLPRITTSLLSHTYFTYGELTSGRQIVLRESEMNKK